MDEIRKVFKSPIFYIILAAFLMRSASVVFGLPEISVYGDETGNTVAAFKLLENKSLIVPFADKAYLPPLFSYMLALVYGFIGFLGMAFGFFPDISGFREFVILYREWFFAPSRLLSAAFGAGTVYLVYLLSKKLFNIRVALLASFLLAFDFLHVHESQVGHIWSPIVFFAVLSVYGFYSLYISGERKWYLVSAVGLGLGYAVGQIGLILYPFFIAFHYLRVKKHNGRFFDKNFVLANILVAAVLVIFTALSFYTVYKHFYDVLFSLARFVGVDGWLAERVDFQHFKNVVQKQNFSFFGNWIFMLKTLFFSFPIIFIAYFAAAVVMLKKFGKDIKNILLFGVPFFVLLVYSLVFYNMLCRYTLMVIPFLIIAVSYFVFWLWEKLSPRANKLVLAFLVFAVSFCSILASVSYSSKLLKPYTVSVGIDWIYKNVPSGKRIVSSSIYLNSTKESVEFLKKYNIENWVDTRKNYILNMDERTRPKPDYFVIETDLTDVFSLPEQEKRADYALIFFYNETGKKSEAEKYAILDVFGERELVAAFYPKREKGYMENPFNILPHFFLKNILETKTLGPNVEIYKFK